MSEYVLLRFNRRTGKIDTTLTGYSKGMLTMWGLNNTTATKDTVVFDKDSGEICAYLEGKKGDMPKICKDMVGLNVEALCEGILEQLQ